MIGTDIVPPLPGFLACKIRIISKDEKPVVNTGIQEGYLVVVDRIQAETLRTLRQIKSMLKKMQKNQTNTISKPS